MSESEYRLFSVDGDTVRVGRVYDEEMKMHRHEYPDFEKTPRLTPNGRRWVNVTKDNCPYADGEYGDCGSCGFFRSEQRGDLIGVCDNEQLIIQGKEA